MKRYWNRLFEGIMNALVDWIIEAAPSLLSWIAKMGIVVILFLLLLAGCLALAPIRPGA